MSDKEKVVVSGGAGFIGRNLVQALLGRGFRVTVIDNFSSGHERFLVDLEIDLINADISNPDMVTNIGFKDAKRIYHLAADVDNRNSWTVPYKSLNANSIGTLNIGLAAKNFGIKEIVYSSSATVYGEHLRSPYFEDQDNSQQTSLYGATKYSGEGILSSFAFHFPIKVVVFRFGNVLGPFCTHGHLYDFVSRLRRGENLLNVLGNGNQIKTYIHVYDVVNALIGVSMSGQFEVYNLSRPDYSTVRDSVKWLSETLNLSFDVEYENSAYGWRGDNPRLFLNTLKIEKTGWKPQITIEKSVKDTVNWLWANQWVFEINS